MTPRWERRLKDPRKNHDSVPPEVRLPPVILPKSVHIYETFQNPSCGVNALVPFADIADGKTSNCARGRL